MRVHFHHGRLVIRSDHAAGSEKHGQQRGAARGFHFCPANPINDQNDSRWRTFTAGSTDIPSASGRPSSPTCPGSKTIFTGTRCTTFTKFPVAFSGGSRLNFDPVPY